MIEVPYHPDRSKNLERFPCKDGAYPCVICGKPCPNPKWMIRLHDGGDSIVTEEEAVSMDEAADLGAYPIGSDCLKAHPEVKLYAVRQ